VLDDATSLQLMVDDEVLAVVDDAELTQVEVVGACASVNADLPSGSPFVVEVTELAVVEG
jgi:hypothetical protein